MADLATRLRQLARLCGARHNIYRFLASGLLESPSEELVRSLLSDDLSSGLSTLFPGLSEFAVSDDAALEQETRVAREDFDALFVVPTSRYLKPFESVYAESSRKGLLMGAPAWSALQYYKQAGATQVRRGGLLPDHIGVEVSFMEFLCAEEDAAWSGGSDDQAVKAISAQARFLAAHLGKWVPELGNQMEENAEGAFYKGVSRLLREAVTRDLATLAFLLPETS